jgi:hypothetical protein
MSQQVSEEELASLRVENARLKALLDQFERERALAQSALERPAKPGQKIAWKGERKPAPKKRALSKSGMICLGGTILYIGMIALSTIEVDQPGPPHFWAVVLMVTIFTPAFVPVLYAILVSMDERRQRKHYLRSPAPERKSKPPREKAPRERPRRRTLKLRPAVTRKLSEL